MAVRANCFYSSSGHRIGQASGTRRSCSLPLSLKYLSYFLCIWPSFSALLVGMCSAAVETNERSLTDLGYPPFFQGKQPLSPDTHAQRPVSFVSRRQRLLTVPREQLILEYDGVIQQHLKNANGRYSSNMYLQEAARGSLSKEQPVKSPAPHPMAPYNQTVTSAKREKTVKQPPRKKKQTVEIPKDHKKHHHQGSHQPKKRTNKAALFQGAAAMVVYLIYFLAVCPASWSAATKYALTSVLATVAYARLAAWHSSRRRAGKD